MAKKRDGSIGRARCDSIYKYIKEFLRTYGYPPSVREIGKAVGLKSSSTVHVYLRKMAERGMIRRDPSKPRAIDLMEDKPWTHTVSVPLVGDVAAGVPIFAEENIEEVYAFPSGLLGTRDEAFMLRVHGESMINVGIFDGDFVLVEKRDVASDGEIVVALVNEEAATVKRYYREKDCIRLVPENDNMKPFYERNVRVLGKVIGVYRHM